MGMSLRLFLKRFNCNGKAYSQHELHAQAGGNWEKERKSLLGSSCSFPLTLGLPTCEES